MPLTELEISQYLDLSGAEYDQRLIELMATDPQSALMLVRARQEKINQQIIHQKDAQILQIVEQKDAQLQQKDIELAQKNAELKRLEIKNMLTSGSTVKRYAYICENIPLEDNLPWPSKPDALIDLMWRKCQESDQVTDPTTQTSEDKHTHPPFLAAIKVICDICSRQCSVRNRSMLHSPKLCPDIIIGQPGLSNFFWSDCMIVIDLKLPTVELQDAVAQGAEYLVYAMEKMAADDKHRILIASNYKSVLVLHASSKNVDELLRTSSKELFPQKWKSLQQPTEGFKLLVQAILVPFPLRKVYDIFSVHRNAICKAMIIGTLYNDGYSAVYIVSINSNSYVLKVGIGRWAKAAIEVEMRNYEEISNIPGMKRYVVAHRFDEYRVEWGYIMDLATPFTHWIDDQPTDMDDTQKNQLLSTHLLTAFIALRHLHANGWRHGDIRPANLVIYKQSLRLIDWATSARLERKADTLFKQGQTDPFWPDNVDLVADGQKWDLIGLGYTFVYFGLIDQDKKEMCAPEGRRELLKNLRNDAAFKGQIANIGARIVEYVESKVGKISDGDYDLMETFFG